MTPSTLALTEVRSGAGQTHPLAGILPIDPAGVHSVTDLRRVGLDARHTATLVRSGALTPLTRGWYAARPPTDARDRHRLLTEAHGRAYAGVAVPSHYSALVALGLPTYRADLGTVHLSRIGPGQARRRPGLRMHRCPAGAASGGSSAGSGGSGAASVGSGSGGSGSGGSGAASVGIGAALAIIQTGMVCGPLDALIAADAALHRRLVTRADLDAAVAAVRGQPRTHLLAGFLALADPRAESPGESRLRHAFHLMRLPVVSQAEITDGGRTAYADFMLVEHPVVAEFDGLVKYGDDPQRSGRAALVAEKAREDWLRGLGFEIDRVVWSELDHPLLLAQRMRRAIERTRGRPAPRAWREAVLRAREREAGRLPTPRG